MIDYKNDQIIIYFGTFGILACRLYRGQNYCANAVIVVHWAKLSGIQLNVNNKQMKKVRGVRGHCFTSLTKLKIFDVGGNGRS